MASAFDCAHKSLDLATSSLPPFAAALVFNQHQEKTTARATVTCAAPESETEDEEVKMNCVGGTRGMEESDMDTTDDSDDDSEDDENAEELMDGSKRKGERGVVDFVTGPTLRNGLALVVRPKATPPPHRNSLSPHAEEQKEMGRCSSGNKGAEGPADGVGVSIDETMTMANIKDPDASRSEGEDGDSGDDDDENKIIPIENALVEPSVRRTSMNHDLERVLFEIRDVLDQTVGEQDVEESESTVDHLLGVSKDHEDFNIPQAKRVLSFNTLAALNVEANADAPKRLKGIFLSPSFMPALNYGSPMVDFETLHKVQTQVLLCRESPVISSSDEDELDGQLRDELDPYSDEKSLESFEERENSPVPLLTPPGSPLTIEVEGGGTTTVCEWPSNLAVDKTP